MFYKEEIQLLRSFGEAQLLNCPSATACAAVTWITSPHGSALKLRKKSRVSAEELTQAFDRFCSAFRAIR
jgi:hypothetical protein